MPTYELTCQACGYRFEVFLKHLLRDEDRVCPVCGSTDVRTGIGGGVVVKPSAETVSPPARGCSPGCGGFGCG